MKALTVGDIAEMLGGSLSGDPTQVVTGITHDSQAAAPGLMFCCVPGLRADGHEFAAAAVAKGAVALLVERPLDIAVPQVLVADSRAALGPVAQRLAGDPSHQLTVIGITGTNGKTTTATMIAQMLGHLGMPCRVIGTLTGTRTTPEAPEVAGVLAQAVRDGVPAVAMEVSSHALALHRVDGIHFRVAVFTNLGTDHLDFHRSPEEYFAAKAGLFDPRLSSAAVVNTDDVHGRLLRDARVVKTIGYSANALEALSVGPDGSRFLWRGVAVTLPLLGRFNVSNALAAAEVARELGYGPEEIAEALASTEAPPGRFQMVRCGQPFTVIVDYAHTPDALENVLATAKDMIGDARLAVVFGCGGDRDVTKRPLMGRVACERADRVIVTSDNPRSESPEAIIGDVIAGCTDDVEIEVDRRAAIGRAFAGALPGDVVVIAGKGHETTQTIGSSVFEFSDAVVAAELLAEMGWTPA